LTTVKTIPSVLVVMVITLREAENVELNKEKDQGTSNKRKSRTKKIQILSREDETPANKSTKFPTHFSYQMNPEQKKEIQSMDDPKMLHTRTL